MGYSVRGMRREANKLGLEKYTISHKVRGNGYSNWFSVCV